MNNENFQLLIYFINERERIRKAKLEGKPFPWTEDKILQKYKFCNVRRIDDAVSQWLYKEYYDSNNVTLAHCLFARVINEPQVLAIFGYPEKITKSWRMESKMLMQIMKNSGKRIVKKVYCVYSNRTPIEKFLFDYAIPKFARLKEQPTFEGNWEQITKIKAFNSFIAGQIVGDLAWFRDFPDNKTFCPMGPGSYSGAKLLEPSLIKKQNVFNEFCLDLYDKLKDTDFAKLHPEIYESMVGIDIQNCLCEFYKYWKILNGAKFGVRRYIP